MRNPNEREFMLFGRKVTVVTSNTMPKNLIIFTKNSSIAIKNVDGEYLNKEGAWRKSKQLSE